MAKTTVIIPNYNGMKYLPQCIASLRRQTEQDFKILVVENASTDRSLEWLTENRIPLIREQENLGFAGGVNAGIRAADTPYVLLLNNDTEVFPDFVEQMEREIARHRKLFSVSAMMLQTQNHSLIDDAGDGMTLMGWAYQRGKGLPRDGYGRGADIFSSCAGAAIYRRDILKKIGLFDEMHFAYLEDIDLCWRAKLHGYFNRYCADARVYHYGSATSGSRYNAFKVRLSARNHIWTMYKNQTNWQLLLHLPWLLAGLFAKAVFFRGLGLFPAWMEGNLEGLGRLHQLRRVDFRQVPTSRLLALEWELIRGTAAYLLQYLERMH